MGCEGCHLSGFQGFGNENIAETSTRFAKIQMEVQRFTSYLLDPNRGRKGLQVNDVYMPNVRCARTRSILDLSNLCTTEFGTKVQVMVAVGGLWCGWEGLVKRGRFFALSGVVGAHMRLGLGAQVPDNFTACVHSS